MTLYEVLKDYQKNRTVLFLLQKGAISLTLLDRMTYYEHYIKLLQNFEHIEALKSTAVEYNVSEKTVRRAIDAMRG